MDLRKMGLVAAAAAALFVGSAIAQEEPKEEPKQDPAQQRAEFMTQRYTDSLGLSEEQSAKVKEILIQTQADRTAAEEATAKEIEALLDEEQAAKYKEFREQMAARRNSFGRRGGQRPEGERGERPEGERGERPEGERGERPEGERGERPEGGERGEGRRGGEGGRGRWGRTPEDQVAALTELLTLSDEQAASILAILEKASTARQEASAKEAEQIKGLLTEEQVAKFDEMRAQREQGRGDRGGDRGGQYY